MPAKANKLMKAEEIQADQFLQGEEKVRAAKRREIQLAIQNYPTKCVDALHARLKTLPLPWEKLHLADSEQQLSTKLQNLKKARAAKQASAKQLQLMDQNSGIATSSAQVGVALPKRARVLADLSPHMLRDNLLSVLQPAFLSKSNLKELRGKEAGSQIGLLRFVEFLTGCDGDFDLPASWRTLGTVALELMQRQKRRPGRLPLLRLDPDWPTEGLYQILEVAPRQVLVQQRATMQTVAVEVDFAIPDDKEPWLDANWSESKVAVRIGDKSVMMGHLFTHSVDVVEDVMATPAPKRMRRSSLALEASAPLPALPAPPVIATETREQSPEPRIDDMQTPPKSDAMAAVAANGTEIDEDAGVADANPDANDEPSEPGSPTDVANED